MPETTPHQPQRQFTHLHLHTEYSPLDKAGSYGIQDDVVVAGYSGSFSNIMGLPVEETAVRIDEFLRSIYGTHGTCR